MTGSAKCLTFLTSTFEETLICSRTLGCIDIENKGITGEEVYDATGVVEIAFHSKQKGFQGRGVLCMYVVMGGQTY